MKGIISMSSGELITWLLLVIIVCANYPGTLWVKLCVSAYTSGITLLSYDKGISSFSKPIIIISLSNKNHAASSDVKWHFFTLLLSAFKFLFILKCYLLLFSSMCRFFCVKENHLTVTQRASPHGLIFYCTSMIRTCCETMTKWQLVPASESINHTKLFSAIITRTPNYSSEKHLKWREKLEGQITFFFFFSLSFIQMTFLTPGFPLSNTPKTVAVTHEQLWGNVACVYMNESPSLQWSDMRRASCSVYLSHCQSVSCQQHYWDD